MRRNFFACVVIFSCVYLTASPVGEFVDGLASADYAVRQESRLALRLQLAEADPQELASLELSLQEFVDPAHPSGTRRWVIHMLELFGGEASVSVLSELLWDKDETVADCARRALIANPSPSAIRVLESALENLPEGHSRSAILEALSMCGDEASVSFIMPWLSSEDGAEAVSAAHALGQIGGNESNAALWESYRTGNASIASHLEWALVDAGLDAEQAAILLQRGSSVAVQEAAIEALVEWGGNPLDILPNVDSSKRVRLISAIFGTPSAKLIIEQLPELSEPEQLIVLGAISDFGLSEHEPMVLRLLESDSESIRQSAIHTLGMIGTDISFESLYSLFNNDPQNDVLRLALSQLRTESVDSTLMADLNGPSSVESKIGSLELLKLRNPEGATTLLNRLAGASQPNPLRRAAFKAMQDIGDMDSVGILLEVIVSEKNLARDAQRSLKKLSVRMGVPRYQWTQAYLPVLKSETDVQSVRAILAILDGVSCEEAVDWMKQQLAVGSPLRADILKSLSRWQDVSAGQGWLVLFQMGDANDAELKTAQRGILRLLTNKEIGGTESEKVQLAVELLRHAPTLELKQSIVACYAPMLGSKENKLHNRTKKALSKAFLQFADDPEIGEQVQAVLDTL
jgi:HEAT repeat protein